MLKCPICEEDLRASIPRTSATGYQDIEFKCSKDHLFFVRVKADDLIDEND